MRNLLRLEREKAKHKDCKQGTATEDKISSGNRLQVKQQYLQCLIHLIFFAHSVFQWIVSLLFSEIPKANWQCQEQHWNVEALLDYPNVLNYL